MSGLAYLPGERGRPLGLALDQALSDPAVRAVVVGPWGVEEVGGRLPERVEHRLLDLLTGDFEIGAVVPHIVSTAGSLLEAGAVLVDGQLKSRGLGEQPDGGAFLRPCDVDGSLYPYVAVGRAVAVRAREGLSATDDDPARLVATLISQAMAEKRRVVFEPLWRVVTESSPSPNPRRQPAGASRAATGRPAVLVVTGFVPSDGFGGAAPAAARLLALLSEQCDPAAISVLALEAFRCRPAADALRAQGYDVTVPPVDVSGWFDEHWGHFGHVFVTSAALRSTARHHVARTQPQAARILCLDSLSFRDLEALRPVTPATESPGLETAIAEELRRTAELVMWADVLWCERPDDAAFLSGLVPGRQVLTVAPALEEPVGESPFGARSGIVVSAIGGHHIGSAAEDSVMEAIERILTPLRRRDPALGFTIVTDRPSPMLERAAADVGADVVPSDQAAAAMDGSRLLVALHPFGTGGSSAVMEAIARGLPFVATPQAVSGMQLGPVAGLSVFGTEADLVNGSWQLLTDKDHWSRVADTLAGLRRSTYGPAARRASVTAALAALGIVPGAGSRRWPALRPIAARPVPQPLHIPLRPPGVRTGPSVDIPYELDERKRYAMWCERHGPTPTVLEAFRAEMEGLEYQPTISVVMPVYNTDPDVLTEAIESVRTQVYDKWQLCIADDGSSRPDTLAVLDEYRQDPAVSIVHLGGNSGISGATNAALALATGEYVAFLDHDDLYKPHALAQVVRWLNADPSLDLVYSDEDKVEGTEPPKDPHIKPDWSPDHLMSNNYVCHLSVIRRSLLDQIGGLRSALDGSQDYDVILRVSELTDRIAHIPEPLYSWRIIPGSAAADAGAKPYAWRAGKAALEDAMRRRGYERGTVEYTANPGIYRCRYPIPGEPKVSIIIPTKNRADLLRPCLESIAEKTTYRNFELVVVDNQSTDAETLGLLAEVPGRVVRYPHRFNYARMMNMAAAGAECDALLFLNNDTRVTSPEWIEAMLEQALRPEVGAVGGRLFFEDGRVQHEGIFLGVVGLAANAHYNGYWGRGEFIRNTSAVTGACMMVRPTVFHHVGGNDERLRVAYNDVDLCLRIRQAGLEVVYTPYATLTHVESASRTYDDAEDVEDGPVFAKRWRPREGVDPYYSPMFVRDWPFLIAV